MKGGKSVGSGSMAAVKLEPEKKELAARPKKARSAYNFYLEKRIAQVKAKSLDRTWLYFLAGKPTRTLHLNHLGP